MAGGLSLFPIILGAPWGQGPGADVATAASPVSLGLAYSRRSIHARVSGMGSSGVFDY